MMTNIFAIALVVMFTAVANATEYGAWTSGVTNDGSGFFAATSNDSGAIFGEWCYTGRQKCIWLIGTDTKCERDAAYPVLANTDTGAHSLMIKCGGTVGDTKTTQYAFESWKDIEGLISGSKMIGFALPMQNGLFKVVRFSLVGEQEVVAGMERKVFGHPTQPDTKDTVL